MRLFICWFWSFFVDKKYQITPALSFKLLSDWRHAWWFHRADWKQVTYLTSSLDWFLFDVVLCFQLLPFSSQTTCKSEWSVWLVTKVLSAVKYKTIFVCVSCKAGVLLILPLLMHGAGCVVVTSVSVSVWWLTDCEVFGTLMQPLASWVIRLMMPSKWESGTGPAHLGGLSVWLCVCACAYWRKGHLCNQSSLCGGINLNMRLERGFI